MSQRYLSGEHETINNEQYTSNMYIRHLNKNEQQRIKQYINDQESRIRGHGEHRKKHRIPTLSGVKFNFSKDQVFYKRTTCHNVFNLFLHDSYRFTFNNHRPKLFNNPSYSSCHLFHVFLSSSYFNN